MPFDLLLPLDGIMEGEVWQVALKALSICPLIPIVLVLVFESRWLPLRPKYQFWAFFPGNVFLAAYITTSSLLLGAPATTGIWQSKGMQAVILLLTIGFYFLARRLDRKAYAPDQIKTPFKQYHNLLYVWYMYLAVMMTIVVISARVPLEHKLLIMSPGFAWVLCWLKDSSFTSPEKLAVKMQTAHANYCPIWKKWSFRRLVALTDPGRYGYAFPGATTEYWTPNSPW